MTIQAPEVAESLDTTEPGFGDDVPERLRSYGVYDRATVIVVAGPNPGQLFVLGDHATIGRDPDAEIHIDDTWVSRKHARIERPENRGCTLVDLGSRNGTFVGGARVERHELRSGDRIHLGPRVLLCFATLNEAEELLQRELFESSVRDPLTKVYNKRYLAERMVAEIAHARRHRSALGLVMFDVDVFKRINDSHGQVIGDLVLSDIAEHVRKLIRAEDVFARFGGDTFVLLVRGDVDPAPLADRIHAVIEDHRVAARNIEVRVTLSIGVALLAECRVDADGSDLLGLADARLRRAKREGRNRVCASDK